MSDVQAWLDQATARLEDDAPTDLTNALNALQAVLDLHRGLPVYGWCRECMDRIFPHHNCPTAQAIRDAIGDKQEHPSP